MVQMSCPTDCRQSFRRACGRSKVV